MTMPHDLSPWGMFLAADVVVKAVLIGLVIASVITWTVWLAKTVELIGARRAARAGVRELGSAHDLATASVPTGTVHSLLEAARRELELSQDTSNADGIKERVLSRLQRIETAEARRIARGTGVLATIGATAPFVGLFGTVWGIMNSFIGIARLQTTNLAVVAPGIAEALLATAVGLAAAIPAVVIYNVFARSIAGYRVALGDAGAEIMRLVSRDLDRAQAGASQRLRVAAE